jgi:antitoxin (DNA-binding transcriptional repressor) of toxin-antitoxin stability system
MKTVEKQEATRSLADYATDVQAGPILVMDHGRPVAALIPVEDADLETISLGTNPRFLDLVQRSRSRAQAEGGISSEEMRKRFA